MSPDFPRSGGGATAAQVWAYGTKELTGDTANAIRDAILSDAIKITGGNIDAAISGRAPAGEYDGVLDTNIASRAPGGEYDAQLDVAVSSRAAIADFSAARAAKLDKIQDFIEEATGSLLMDGTEQTIKEILTTINKLQFLIDLTPMAASDTVVVRQFIKIAAAGSFIKYADETYDNVQALPMLYIVTKPARYGIRVTLEQTAGTMRTFDWETFQNKAA